MASTTFIDRVTPIMASWLNDVNTSTYKAASGISGAADRTAVAKFADVISVKDFGATGDGVTDDYAAIQAAQNYACLGVGKSLYFPTPVGGAYNVSTAIRLNGSVRWFGENMQNTIIRKTGGTGTVITVDSFGGLGPNIIENMRIGGAGCIGITETPVVFTGSISGTTLTITSIPSGYSLEVGATITGSGVTAGTTVVSGSGNSWVVSASQTVSSTTMTQTNSYVVDLHLKNVAFEGDLVWGVKANLIFANFEDCNFGSYTQTATNAAFGAIYSHGNGVLNSNQNSFTRCKFVYTKGTYAIDIATGINWTFNQCDFEQNQKCLTMNNITNLHFIGCWNEGNHGCTLATDHAWNFGFGSVKFSKCNFDGGTHSASTAMFGVGAQCTFEADGCFIAMANTAYVYYNNSTVSFVTPINGAHQFRNCILAPNNASDPLTKYLGYVADSGGVDIINENAGQSFTPVPTGLTVVNGSGGATYVGFWSVCNRKVDFTIRIIVTGTCTTAATANTTYFAPIPNLPLPIQSFACSVVQESPATGTSMGSGIVYSVNGRIYMPTWAALNGAVVISGSYLF